MPIVYADLISMALKCLTLILGLPRRMTNGTKKIYFFLVASLKSNGYFKLALSTRFCQSHQLVGCTPDYS